PRGVLAAGRNEIVVRLEQQGGPRLQIQAATAGREDGLPWQTVDLSVPHPEAAPCLSLEMAAGADHRGKCWTVTRGGFRVFQVRLAQTTPVAFSLALPEAEDDGWADDLQELLEEVLEKVQDRRQELEEARGRGPDPFRNGAGSPEQGIRLLEAYQCLHNAQIAPAFRS